LKKIGIIIDEYHLNYKVTDFLKYLRTIAEVNIYMEESYCLLSSTHYFDEDVFFVKGKGDIILGLVKLIEESTDIPVINSFKATWLSINRFLNSTYLRKAGIPVPDFCLNPIGMPPPFKNYIIKNIIDQGNYKFNPIVLDANEGMKVADKRALDEEHIYNFFYYQEFIKSKWEYKIYGIGENVYFYKQIPILVNPNKTASRQKIEKISELEEYCFKAMDIMNIEVTSLDFHRSEKNQFFLTDINCTPNFNYMKNGHKIVADYLIEQAKK
jgi:hypothetical protein